MLHCFKGNDFINADGGYNYWCNCCSDLFHPLSKRDLRVEELPSQLRHAFENLWIEGAGARCYLVQFKNKYGVALELEYEDDWIEETDVVNNHDELVEFARKKAEMYAKKYPEYDVIFGEDSQEWQAAGYFSEFNTIVSIIIPWNATSKEVFEVAKDMYKTGYAN